MLKMNVMLVDDEVGFLDAMQRRLSKRGIDVVTASGGQEALDLLEESGTRVEVIVLDVKMPGIDGLETLRRIKQSHPVKEVIMLTGHGTVDSAIEGMKLGAFDYLIKPCDVDVLIFKIKAAKQIVDDKMMRIAEARAAEINLRMGG